MLSHFSGLLQIISSLHTFAINNDAAIGLLKGKIVVFIYITKFSFKLLRYLLF